MNNSFWRNYVLFDNGSSEEALVNGSILTANSGTYMVSDAPSLLNSQIKGTGQKFSIVMRVKRTWADQAYQTVFSRDNNSGGRQFACEWDNEERMTFFIADDDTKYSWWKTTDSFVRTNSFYTFGFTFDNTQALADKCKIYVDGVEVTTTRVDLGGGVSDVNDQPLEPIYIAVTNFGGLINPFQGYTSSISFYTGILTAADNLAIYNGGSVYDERSGLSISPYMYWNFGNSTVGASITTNDLMGTSYPVSKQFTSVGAVTLSSAQYPIPLVYNAASDTLFAAFSVQPSATRKALMDDFITGCITDNNWNEFESAVWLAAPNQTDSKVNWKSPGTFNPTEIGTPTFTVDEGFTGSATAGIDTNFNGANGTKYVLNSGAMGVYLRLDINAAVAAMGNISGSDASIIVPRNGGTFAGRLNSATNTTVLNADTLRLISIVRTASNVQAVWKHITQLTSSGAVSTSTINNNIYVLGYNSGGTLTLPTANQASFYYISSGAVDMAKLGQRVQNYMIGIGKDV